LINKITKKNKINPVFNASEKLNKMKSQMGIRAKRINKRLKVEYRDWRSKSNQWRIYLSANLTLKVGRSLEIPNSVNIKLLIYLTLIFSINQI